MQNKASHNQGTSSMFLLSSIIDHHIDRNENLLSRVGGHVEAHESDASDEDARQDQVEHYHEKIEHYHGKIEHYHEKIMIITIMIWLTIMVCRVDIWRDRCDLRSRKILGSCVNFSENNANC